MAIRTFGSCRTHHFVSRLTSYYATSETLCIFHVIALLLLCSMVPRITAAVVVESSSSSSLPQTPSRRSWMRQTSISTASCLAATMMATSGADAVTRTTAAAAGPLFLTSAQGRAEYTNSITASRDTNISPQEAYDTILALLPPAPSLATTSSLSSVPQQPRKGCCYRALDVGAGAGLSTAYLYNQLGYRHHLDAIDWSRAAWDEHVRAPVPATVHFYAESDDTFFRRTSRRTQPNADDTDYDHNKDDDDKYHVILYNFAINPVKAVQVAIDHLVPTTGRLLAPVNNKTDYLHKQSYWLLDSTGTIVMGQDSHATSESSQSPAGVVGAWSVQFQPDVTSESCTGIWCGNFNGYQQQRTAPSSPPTP
jgi:SAM-dependent methyltransferase